MSTQSEAVDIDSASARGEITMASLAPYHRVAIALFLLALLVPGACALVGWGTIPDFTENRDLAPFPRDALHFGTVGRFAREFDAFASDNFGFREAGILAVAHIKMALGSSPSADVLVGKNGWLVGSGDLDERRGTVVADPVALDAWRVAYQDRAAFVRGLGAYFLMVIPPDKETVYPEALPDWIVKQGNETRVRHATDVLRSSGIDVLDLKDALLANRNRDGRLYYKYDTHWNTLGAFVGAEAMVNYLRQRFPNIPAFNRSDYIVTQTSPGQRVDEGVALDYGILIGNPFLKERGFHIEKKGGWTTTKALSDDGSETIETYVKDAPDLPSVVVYTDSFGFALRPFLSEYFRRAAFVNVWEALDWAESQFPLDIVSKERPDIFIYLRYEQGLSLATNPPELRAALAAQRQKN
jgi:alginate O-acetyltransferase complex protein AlgJ